MENKIKKIIEKEIINYLNEGKRENLLQRIKGYVKTPGKPWYYMHMTDIDAPADMMYYPSSPHATTPLGIYAYPLSPEIFEQLKHYQLPFRAKTKKLVIFKLRDGFQNFIFHIGKDRVRKEILTELKRIFLEEHRIEAVESKIIFDNNMENYGLYEPEELKREFDVFHDFLKSSIEKYYNRQKEKFFTKDLTQKEKLKIIIALKKQFNESYEIPLANFHSKLSNFYNSYEIFFNIVEKYRYEEKINVVNLPEIYNYVDEFHNAYVSIKEPLKYWEQMIKSYDFFNFAKIRTTKAKIYSKIFSFTLPRVLKRILGSIDKFTNPLYEYKKISLERYDSEDVDSDFAELWNVTRHLAELKGDNIIFQWAQMFVKLGIIGFHDHGEGLIHPNEPEQAVIFHPNKMGLTLRDIIETIDIINNPARIMMVKTASGLSKQMSY